MNYSTTGFQLVLTRKMSFYVVTYYLPSGLFVVVSWIRYIQDIFIYIPDDFNAEEEMFPSGVVAGLSPDLDIQSER